MVAFIKMITIANLTQKLFLVVLMVVKLRASPFVLIDPATGRAVEQVFIHFCNQRGDFTQCHESAR